MKNGVKFEKKMPKNEQIVNFSHKIYTGSNPDKTARRMTFEK